MSTAVQLQLPLFVTPAVLPPALAARIAVTADGHWFLRPCPDGRGTGGAIGATQSKGYASVCVGGKTYQLARLVLTAVAGAPAPGAQACHNDARCPWRHCVAPACLRWASSQENQRDATRKRLARRAERQAAA